jgi:hypothetical protein
MSLHYLSRQFILLLGSICLIFSHPADLTHPCFFKNDNDGSRRLDPRRIIGSKTINQKVVYVGSDHKTICAVEEESATSLWSIDLLTLSEVSGGSNEYSIIVDPLTITADGGGNRNVFYVAFIVLTAGSRFINTWIAQVALNYGVVESVYRIEGSCYASSLDGDSISVLRSIPFIPNDWFELLNVGAKVDVNVDKIGWVRGTIVDVIDMNVIVSYECHSSQVMVKVTMPMESPLLQPYGTKCGGDSTSIDDYVSAYVEVGTLSGIDEIEWGLSLVEQVYGGNKQLSPNSSDVLVKVNNQWHFIPPPPISSQKTIKHRLSGANFKHASSSRSTLSPPQVSLCGQHIRFSDSMKDLLYTGKHLVVFLDKVIKHFFLFLFFKFSFNPNVSFYYFPFYSLFIASWPLARSSCLSTCNI